MSFVNCQSGRRTGWGPIEGVRICLQKESFACCQNDFTALR
jgi:hypothetical protein